jgi:Ca-activated chloride channel family protein
VSDADRITPHVVPEGTRTGYDIDLSVKVDAGVKVRSLESINHEVDEWIDGDGVARVELSDGDRIPNKDFVLRYTTGSDEIEFGVLATCGSLGGHFMLIIQPDVNVDRNWITPKELFFVVDCSGSMGGHPMSVAKEAMRQFISGMNQDDTFHILKFSNTASTLSDEPLSNADENVELGLAYVESMSGSGGTMMINGVRGSIGYPEDPDRMRFIIFLTDGLIGNEEEILSEVRSTLGENTRLFSIGVGSSPNRYLIEGLAEEGRGHAYYVALDEDPEEAVESETVRVNGEVDMLPLRSRVRVELPDQEEDNSVIATLWARKRIHELTRMMMDQRGRIHSDTEIIELITRTAVNYQILSDYTAFLAVSEEVRTDPDGNPVRVEVPVNMPDGVSYSGVFGPSDPGMHLRGGREGGLASQAVGVTTIQVTDQRSMIQRDVTSSFQITTCETVSGGFAGIRPNVSYVSANPLLGLDAGEVRDAIEDLLDEVGEEYVKFILSLDEDDEIPQGTVSVALEIRNDGTVVNSSVSVDRTGNSDLADAVAGILGSVVMAAPPEGGGTIYVTVSLSYM